VIVGFVCTNYNGSDYTRAALASLLDAPRGRDVRVVVVDNRSSPEDVAALQQVARSYDGVELVLNPENVGYFPGLNIGIHRLRASFPDIEHVIVGNNDLVFPGDLVDRIEGLRPLLDTWAVVAPDLVTPDGLHQNPHVVAPIGRVRKLVWDVYHASYWAARLILKVARLTSGLTVRPERAPDSPLFRVAGPIEMGLGACYVLGPVFFRHFEQLCAPTLLMQEEFFLAEQLASIGQKTYYEPRLVVQHRDHGTMHRLPGREYWRISRQAHHVYKRYLTMSPEERGRFIETASRGDSAMTPLGGGA
jgi:glycosyltransferase involved in cell wall biosynthesis